MMAKAKLVLFNFGVLAACSTPSDRVRNVREMRGMKPVTPIHASHHLIRRTSSSERPIVIRNFEGDEVEDGDYIQALVTPKDAVYLYLAYCDDGEFALFPSMGSIRAGALNTTRIPPGDTGLQVQGDSRTEILYLILSKSELSLANPDLTIKIASHGGSVDGDCGPGPSGGLDPRDTRWKATDLRADTAIEVFRYEFKHRTSAGSP